jgi:hypothetical protein
MTGAQLTLEFAPVSAVVALLVTVAIAYLLGSRLEKWPAVLIAGLALPMAVLILGGYHAATAPDDFPRGMILIATLGVAAATSPITLIVSYLAAGFARG